MTFKLNPLETKINVTKTPDGMIFDVHGLAGEHIRTVMNFKDDQVRKRLIELGWTPPEEKEMTRVSIGFEFPLPEGKNILAKLRALRLWHWRRVLEQRSNQQLCFNDKAYKLSRSYEVSADFHLAQVQLLNEFFPVGDTAEGDDK